MILHMITWADVTTAEEMRNAAHQIYEYGGSCDNIIKGASIEAYALADKMDADEAIKSQEGFGSLVDWTIEDMMGLCQVEGGFPPSIEWLLKEGERRGYTGEDMVCLKDIAAGNGYKYV